MANRGQSRYLRVFDNAGTYLRWQSYYVGQTVTWTGQSWSYFPFQVDGLIGGTPTGDGGITIQVPATTVAVKEFEDALRFNRLCEVLLYEFSTVLSQNQPQSGQLLIGQFVGEVVSVGGSFSSLSVRLGSSLAPVGAQVPPRKFTNELIGAPIRL
jgi:hypothetical protein